MRGTTAIVATRLVLAFCLVPAARSATAAPPPAPPLPQPAGPPRSATSGEERSGDPRTAAQAALARGNQRLKEGDAAGALLEYRRAQGLYPAAATKIEFNIAKAEQARGDKPAAATAFERFLAQALEVSPEFRDEAQKELHRLAAALGSLKVVEKRPGLLVTIDGETQGKTPLPNNLWVRPGRRVITVSDGDRVAFRGAIDVGSGATVEVDVTVRVNSAAPPTAIAPSGSSLPLQLTAAQQEKLQQGEPASVDRNATDGSTPRPIWKRWWFWGAAAGAVIAGLVTVYLITADRCPANTVCMPATLD